MSPSSPGAPGTASHSSFPAVPWGVGPEAPGLGCERQGRSGPGEALSVLDRTPVLEPGTLSPPKSNTTPAVTVPVDKLQAQGRFPAKPLTLQSSLRVEFLC